MDDLQQQDERGGDVMGIDSSEWVAEREFFDLEADRRGVMPLNPRVVERYAHPTRHWSLDFRFRLAGDLRGKRVLDVGAGTGENSLVLAALGAKVTAVDISPRSLEILRKGAELSGVSERIETICQPLEEWHPQETFDIIWVDAFLHHVLSNLEFVLGQLQSFAGPHGRFIIAEPFAPSVLRRVRLALPIPTNGTPGERPLNSSELRLIRTYFPGMRTRHFLFLSRLHPYVPGKEMFAAFDAAFLRLPVVKLLGGAVVLWT